MNERRQGNQEILDALAAHAAESKESITALRADVRVEMAEVRKDVGYCQSTIERIGTKVDEVAEDHSATKQAFDSIKSQTKDQWEDLAHLREDNAKHKVRLADLEAPEESATQVPVQAYYIGGGLIGLLLFLAVLFPSQIDTLLEHVERIF